MSAESGRAGWIQIRRKQKKIGLILYSLCGSKPAFINLDFMPQSKAGKVIKRKYHWIGYIFTNYTAPYFVDWLCLTADYSLYLCSLWGGRYYSVQSAGNLMQPFSGSIVCWLAWTIELTTWVMHPLPSPPSHAKPYKLTDCILLSHCIQDPTLEYHCRTIASNMDQLTNTKAKCRHLKKFTCKGTLRQVSSRVYRLEIHSVMLVFSTQLCELLPL
jgi:hypothetical protein